ncbi:Haloacid dehalogenase-like hydrolase domain-containing 5 [Merluccius polli]|uniref:Haloacid dehalogenase-like hydrolase domain-containing 5 n=1 Tax=Merluccius polli TaxID=89951 RepID=A0AA47MSD4_MERPO|nr:Haloacid dehalogenase-like hydrolase domain-containing 5 [Merluccius polli]
MQRIPSFRLGWRLLQSATEGAKQTCVSPPSLRKYSHGQGSFGLLFDIDGVLVRGTTPIPAAKQIFRDLVDPAGRYKVPVVFVTNAGNCLRQTKAEQLSHLLEVEVSHSHVHVGFVLPGPRVSHSPDLCARRRRLLRCLQTSPLRMFTQFHDLCVLVSGQGPIKEVAQILGFQNVITVDMLREACPLLDVVDHNRRPKGYVPEDKSLPQIDAVILFGEPIRWETNIQLIIDVLLTNGKPGNVQGTLRYPHIPVLACNMDLLWMAEAKNPRFGHGMFLVCLESVYKKITGYDLKYEALIGKPSVVTYNYAELLVRKQAESLGWTEPVETLYAIGDNPMADIYGANLYNRYLQACQRARLQAKGPGGGGQLKGAATVDDPPAMTSTELGGVSGMYGIEERLPERCSSILVCTGVYSRDQQDLPQDPACALKEQQQRIFHGHRDFRFDPSLTQPSFVVQDVREAVELVFQQEGCPLG